ncbi:MAG: GNAT family N-acetyltransferase [Gammaproteobacteria bacterium]|nr:GNAT family N-acetyltransferase [Gammaproteobacteria bacterium]
MTNSDINYQQLPAIKLPLANKFYRQVGARAKASGGDMVWVARDNSTAKSATSTAVIIAVARLAPIVNKYHLLTGVYVDDNYRQQGIASQLIEALVNQQSPCYTFALNHLELFYLRLGFEPIADDNLPCELAQRFRAYQQQGRKIVAMIKK